MPRGSRFFHSFAILLLFASLASGQQGVKKPQKFALLIGVSKYPAGLGELPCCQDDLTALKDCLVAAGFPAANIVYLHDKAAANLQPTKANIEAQLKLRMKLPLPGDQVVVAFSGHGLHVEGKSYLCPIEARLDEPAETMIALEDFEQEIGSSQATQKLLILDAWRNDPLRAAKAARGPQERPQLPRPRGLRVLSSCEAGQYSVDDPKLKRGVFMNYVTLGWQGAADREAEGDGDGKVTLEELYYYAHEKTKIHVANAFAALQLPTLTGDAAARWDLAVLTSSPESKTAPTPAPPAKPPVATKVAEPAAPKAEAQQPPPKAVTKSPSGPETHPLLTQAHALYNRAEYAKAISTYTSIISNSDLSSGIRRAARLGRGSCYLAQGGKDNIQKSLIDYKAAGYETISLPVRKETNLMLSANAMGALKENEVVQISVINGEWLWVTAVNGNTSKRGYVKWEAVLPPPPPPAAAP